MVLTSALALAFLTSPALRRIERHVRRIHKVLNDTDDQTKAHERLALLELERFHEILHGHLD